MDNEQFKFGHALKTNEGYFSLIMDGIKKFYVTKIKRFNVDTMCVMTLLFEADKKDIQLHEKKIYEIAAKFGGIPAGEKNGERGYMLTFVIAYIRVRSSLISSYDYAVDEKVPTQANCLDK